MGQQLARFTAANTRKSAPDSGADSEYDPDSVAPIGHTPCTQSPDRGQLTPRPRRPLRRDGNRDHPTLFFRPDRGADHATGVSPSPSGPFASVPPDTARLQGPISMPAALPPGGVHLLLDLECIRRGWRFRRSRALRRVLPASPSHSMSELPKPPVERRPYGHLTI
jgi:hypothetical protein